MIVGQIKYSNLHLDDVHDIESQVNRVTTIKTQQEISPISNWIVIAGRNDRLAKKREDFIRMLAGSIAAGHDMSSSKNIGQVAKDARSRGAAIRSRMVR